MKFFKENLKLLRTAWKLSQEEVGAKFGVGQTAYRKWEAGAEPDLDTLIGLANFFKVPFGDFILKELKPQDVPPRWGGREYPQQPDETALEVQEPSDVKIEMAELRKEMAELKKEVRAAAG